MGEIIDNREAIRNVVEIYLKVSTNNALVITGDYGIGKTYFFKKHLMPLIDTTTTPQNAAINYKSIHVSLFGIKSIEDLQTQIFISLFPFLKDKSVKLAVGVVKTLARGISNFYRGGNINDYLKDLETAVVDTLNYSELVICIDDLDRKSTKLDLPDVFGFINSIVENENAKVILIANEDKLEDQYKNSLKEKVIGNTIHFIPDEEITFDEIINERYKETYKDYYDYLIINKELILNFLKNENFNFRILIFFFEYFQIIFSEFKKDLQEKREESLSLNNDKLVSVMKFSLAIAIEYKKGIISYQNKGNLNKSEFSYPLDEIDAE